jgi:uncharacterized iron-regulated membrane protein
MRKTHRWIGLGSAVFVLLATITGLLWAYAPYLYWEAGYMERKHPPGAVSLETASLAPRDAIRAVKARLGENFAPSAVRLHADYGLPLYEVIGPAGKKKTVTLVDAVSGQIASPITGEQATEIARQYVPGTPTVKEVRLLDQFEHRKGKIHDAVYSVQFATPRNTEILLSAASGEILEEQDDVRRFHFWVMRLHQLNFFGFHKTLTIIPGVALLILTASGIAISRRRRAGQPKTGTDGQNGAASAKPRRSEEPAVIG